MKRPLIPTALFAALVALAAPYATLADSTLSVQPVAGPLSVGDSFNVEVDIAGATDLYGLQFDLDYDSTLLSFDGATEGSFLTSGGQTNPITIDNGGGSITFLDFLTGAVPGVSGDGGLVLFNFTALANGTSTLDLANIILLNSNLESINSNVNNGSVTIGSTAVPEPDVFTLLISGLISFALFVGPKRA